MSSFGTEPVIYESYLRTVESSTGRRKETVGLELSFGIRQVPVN